MLIHGEVALSVVANLRELSCCFELFYRYERSFGWFVGVENSKVLTEKRVKNHGW